MSLQVLTDLHQEVRRLFIAGSSVAVGDLRLTRLLPQLRKLGENAPVFNRLADAVQLVTEARPEQASAKLLELGTLLHSILYTQGRTEAQGTLEEVQVTETRGVTAVPYRKMKSLIDALTERGPGRLEVIRQGYEDSLFQDFRTHVPAVAALEDAYAEIAEFMYDDVIPSIGPAVVPILHRQLNLQGGKGDARKLYLIHHLQGPVNAELILQAAGEGAAEVRIAAVDILGDYPELEDVVLEKSYERRKEIRRAALSALSRLGTGRAADRLFEALVGKDRELAVEPIQAYSHPTLIQRILDQAEAWLNAFDGSAVKTEAVEQLFAVVQCLKGKNDETVRVFLEKLLSSPAFMVKETAAVQEYAAELLLDMQRPEGYRFVESLYRQWGGRHIAYSFQAALRCLSPEEVYDRFADLLRNKRQAQAKELLRTLYDLTEQQALTLYLEAEDLSPIAWDPRWVHLFVDIDEEELVCRFVEGPDRKVVDYLLKKLAVAPQLMKPRTISLFFALFKIGHRETPELLMQALEGSEGKRFYFMDRDQLVLMSLLPGSYAERLEKFAALLSYERAKQEVLEVAERLKTKTKDEAEMGKGAGWIEWIKSKMY
ncbi:HEAT repeat domain-containing protein [Paenibacillus ehimensis]|uniref:HEAT repeat domain-containing protein n=1 Tax=Paenibacillus ehimensis TaxID=79264 RepID=A0ABT8VJ71_9BACL|nr:HEAT repeat domain-containing protein [Paenibacillus ehimensis]MDO3681040.1 HEAT repeat domain-containing protein [Paenibacillus ehimensis]